MIYNEKVTRKIILVGLRPPPQATPYLANSAITKKWLLWNVSKDERSNNLRDRNRQTLPYTYCPLILRIGRTQIWQCLVPINIILPMKPHRHCPPLFFKVKG